MHKNRITHALKEIKKYYIGDPEALEFIKASSLAALVQQIQTPLTHNGCLYEINHFAYGVYEVRKDDRKIHEASEADCKIFLNELIEKNLNF